MKMDQIRVKAKAVGVNVMRKSKEAVIREIQRAEGNRDCFNRGESRMCGQDKCAWRVECK
jgi:hypothetical protein